MIETTAAHFPVLNLFQHLLLFLTHFFWISILPAKHSFAVVRNVILLSVLVGCFLFGCGHQLNNGKPMKQIA